MSSSSSTNPDFDTVNDAYIARIYSGLKTLDNGIASLKKAPIYNKADAAENVIKDTRELLGQMALTIHALKNEIVRLKAKS